MGLSYGGRELGPQRKTYISVAIRALLPYRGQRKGECGRTTAGDAPKP